jgi:50S ribosomal subunit-associated GTPase HflX
MEAKDREIWVGQNWLYLSEDNILHVIGGGDVDEELAIKLKEAVLKDFFNLEELKGKKIPTLIDVNKAGRQSSKARKIWKELVEHEKTGKIAFCGLHPVASVIAAFVMGISRKEDMRFFKTREEALSWLKQNEEGCQEERNHGCE